jgi:hypothetical protein
LTRSYTQNETKLKALEKERPDEMEMAAQENEKRKEKKNEEISFLILSIDFLCKIGSKTF